MHKNIHAWHVHVKRVYQTADWKTQFEVQSGTEMTIMLTPSSGYKVKPGSVHAKMTANDGSVVDLTLDYDSQTMMYSFDMPANTVTVSAEFEQRQTYTLTRTWDTVNDVSAYLTVQETLESPERFLSDETSEVSEDDIVSVIFYLDSEVISTMILKNNDTDETITWSRNTSPDSSAIWRAGRGVRFLMPAYNATVSIEMTTPDLIIGIVPESGVEVAELLNMRLTIGNNDSRALIHMSSKTNEEVVAMISAGTLTLTSSNPSVATCSFEGQHVKIEPKAEGKTVITATNTSTNERAFLEVSVQPEYYAINSDGLTSVETEVGNRILMKYIKSADLPDINHVHVKDSGVYYEAEVSFAETISEGKMVVMYYTDAEGNKVGSTVVCGSRTDTYEHVSDTYELMQAGQVILNITTTESAVVTADNSLTFSAGNSYNFAKTYSVRAGSLCNTFTVSSFSSEQGVDYVVFKSSEAFDSGTFVCYSSYGVAIDGANIQFNDTTDTFKIPLTVLESYNVVQIGIGE